MNHHTCISHAQVEPLKSTGAAPCQSKHDSVCLILCACTILSWNIMEYHGISWNIMEYHGISWNTHARQGMYHSSLTPVQQCYTEPMCSH